MALGWSRGSPPVNSTKGSRVDADAAPAAGSVVVVIERPAKGEALRPLTDGDRSELHALLR